MELIFNYFPLILSISFYAFYTQAPGFDTEGNLQHDINNLLIADWLLLN